MPSRARRRAGRALALTLVLVCACRRPVAPAAPAPAAEASLAARLAQAWAQRGPDYRPRTRHLTAEGRPRYTNRLFLETSPYLLQHAHNPVNWYPWGDEAFAAARRLGRPVLLSVGYSTCHWCHVMEEESFEDEALAAYLNDHYVAIKVDREERPDIDAQYMAAVQALTGSGGWPMTVWLTPDRRPFHGGTYFTPAAFGTVLRKLHEAYAADPTRVAATAAQLTRSIAASLAPAAGDPARPTTAVLDGAARYFRGRFDPVEGGLQGQRKFPSSLPIRFLLREHRRTGDLQLLTMATLTLDRMAAGGIHDQVGGGFHRYATDPRWQVPHFEQMLYDNALLAIDYLEAYQVLGREDLAEVARRILGYVERDMTAPSGAFFSATDADSPGPGGKREEGRFFTWTPDEVAAVLGPARARAVSAFYGVTAAGNFEGRTILHVGRPLLDVARELGLPPADLSATIAEASAALYAARRLRPPPLRDDKILASWNGLMVSALARAAVVLGGDEYARRAARAADFVLTRMRVDGRLRRTDAGGARVKDGYLDDYACVIAGLLDLHEATAEPRWLAEAVALEAVLERHYADDQGGGFFLSADDAEALLSRDRPAYDGAEPSGNSVAALDLLRLAELTGDERYRQRAGRLLAAFAATLQAEPAALSTMLEAVDFQLDTPRAVVIVTPMARAEAGPLLEKLRTTFLPNRTLTVLVAAEVAARAARLPLVEGKVAMGGKATAYVCAGKVCERPTTDPEVFARQIRGPWRPSGN